METTEGTLFYDSLLQHWCCGTRMGSDWYAAFIFMICGNFGRGDQVDPGSQSGHSELLTLDAHYSITIALSLIPYVFRTRESLVNKIQDPMVPTSHSQNILTLMGTTRPISYFKG